MSTHTYFTLVSLSYTEILEQINSCSSLNLKTQQANNLIFKGGQLQI